MERMPADRHSGGGRMPRSTLAPSIAPSRRSTTKHAGGEGGTVQRQRGGGSTALDLRGREGERPMMTEGLFCRED
ncbi:hypothetical protein T484DRAFT_1849633 [Baffinella frigidus]|nr:hypothetical protein T484DRAFT_1849633 [Cryptophyta sp. CCMP2293]